MAPSTFQEPWYPMEDDEFLPPPAFINISYPSNTLNVGSIKNFNQVGQSFGIEQMKSDSKSLPSKKPITKAKKSEIPLETALLIAYGTTMMVMIIMICIRASSSLYACFVAINLHSIQCHQPHKHHLSNMLAFILHTPQHHITSNQITSSPVKSITNSHHIKCKPLFLITFPSHSQHIYKPFPTYLHVSRILPIKMLLAFVLHLIMQSIVRPI